MNINSSQIISVTLHYTNELTTKTSVDCYITVISQAFQTSKKKDLATYPKQ